MEKLSKEVPKKKKDIPKKQGEAFKTYLMARRQFGAGRVCADLYTDYPCIPFVCIMLIIINIHVHVHVHVQEFYVYTS